jgi:hypothetical protein
MRAAMSRSCVTATTVLLPSCTSFSRMGEDLLVGEDERRIVGERASHRHALALAARKLVPHPARLPGDFERQIAAFVEHYNQQHYHESLDNLP